MASNLFASLLLIVLLSVAISINANKALINKTCMKTHFYKLCVKTLESDPLSVKASDARGLAVNMVHFGVARASGILNFLNYTLRSPEVAKNVTLQNTCKYCAGKYVTAIRSLRSSNQEIDKKNVPGAQKLLGKVMKSMEACRHKFNVNHVTAYPVELVHKEKKLTRIVAVTRSIVAKLA
ncbi:hypothetical protein Droror1_Dr00020802 [Drosera rotundifolia]